MNALLDDSLVVLLLVASFLYAFAKLGPKKTWRRMLAIFAALLARAPAVLHLHAAAQRLAGAAAEKKLGACGGCDNCASQAGPAAAAGAEIRVPIANIAGRGARSRSSR